MDFEERIQRNIDFIVEHQAQFDANLDRLTANVDRMSAPMDSEHQHRVDRDRELAMWISKVSEVLVLQSSRMDLEHEEIVRLDRILERLAS